MKSGIMFNPEDYPFLKEMYAIPNSVAFHGKKKRGFYARVNTKAEKSLIFYHSMNFYYETQYCKPGFEAIAYVHLMHVVAN